MAIDQALLERARLWGERWLRLYTWQPHCLSFGRNERAEGRYDRAKIERVGLDVVRRPTGGRAVWHARELTYAVVAPADELGGLRSAYLETHRMLQGALSRLGAEASLADARHASGLDAGACFARPVGGELMVRGKKVVGSAQLREGGAWLQHGSILLVDDQRVVGVVSRGEAPADGSAPLSLLLGREVSAFEAADAVADAARDRWRGDWSDRLEAETVLVEAKAHLPRFCSDRWTWDR
jgi:lipoyl(octanoyl) transferase